jgi:hypothetical protein
MLRQISCLLIVTLVLAGCGRRQETEMLLSRGRLQAPAELAAAPEIAIASNASGQIFSYSHTISLLMARDAIRERYDRARMLCLQERAMRCKLMTASLDDSDAASAHLEVALPHDKIAAYEANLLKPVQKDKDGIEVTSRTTRAESVETQASDTDKKVAQLTKYRDGLAELAKKPNLNVDDFIKVQEELSKTEADLDEALSQKRDIGDRIARESLTIDLTQRFETVSPLGQAWRDSGDLLTASTADMLRFVVQMIPWLPIMAALFFLLRWAVSKIARRRVAVAKSKGVDNGA